MYEGRVWVRARTRELRRLREHRPQMRPLRLEIGPPRLVGSNVAGSIRLALWQFVRISRAGFTLGRAAIGRGRIERASASGPPYREKRGSVDQNPLSAASPQTWYQTVPLIEPCMANVRRATNGSPACTGEGLRSRSSAGQASIEGAGRLALWPHRACLGGWWFDNYHGFEPDRPFSPRRPCAGGYPVWQLPVHTVSTTSFHRHKAGGKKRTFRAGPDLVNKPDPTEAGSVGITQETAEPSRLSPAEPADSI